MTRLVVAELRRHARLWVWTVLVAAVSSGAIGAVIASSATVWASAGTAGVVPDARQAASVLGSNLVMYTGLAVIAVVSATAGLTVQSQARGYALWKILGMPARRISRVVRAQLALAGLAGGLLGLPMTLLITPVFTDRWRGAGLLPAGAPLVYPVWMWVVPPLVVAALTLLGGWRTAGAAGRTSEMAAMRDAVLPRAKVGWARLLVALVLLTGIVTIPFTPDDEMATDPDAPPFGAAAAMGISTLLLFLALVLAPWTLRATLYLWTAVAPVRGVAWDTAVATARLRSARSTTTVLPFALSSAVIGVFMGAGNMGGEGDVTVSELMLVFGLVFLVCWVGGVAVIAMVGRERGRDAALLGVLGASPRQVAVATLAEGIIYAGTALVFGAVLTAVSVVLMALGSGVAVLPALARGPWAELGALALATLGVTGAAVTGPALEAGRARPAERLREPV